MGRDVQRYLAHKKHPPPYRLTIGPWAYGYCRVLRFFCFVMSEVPLYPVMESFGERVSSQLEVEGLGLEV